MALRPDYNLIESDISWSCETAIERGVVLVKDTSGSGISLGDSSGKGDLVLNPSGKVVLGYLLQDVVSIDETLYHRNFQKVQQKTGEKVELMTKGWLVTNKLTGTPAVGDTAYLTTSGVVTPTMSTTGGTVATPKVGKFMSIKDADGYARVDINLPVV